jgi:mevalonate kinase
MVVGYGFGKVILFGEHFVVYGLPAIAAGINQKTTADIEKSHTPGIHVVDNRPEVAGYKVSKADQFKDSIDYIKKAIPQVAWDVQGVKIRLGGDLVAASGVGASAASCVAIARAINQFFDLNLNDDRINEIAFEGEKGYHGTPSGIDNTCATYGTLILFEKHDEGNVMEKLELDHTVEIVMANTGIPVNTKAVVANVRKLVEKEPDTYKQTFDEYSKIFEQALPALKEGNWKKVGELMDKNQELLRKIGVSHEKLEELIQIAKENGAYGAKLTGGGAGGYMVAIAPGKELQEKVATALSEKVEIVLKTTIGGKGKE